MSLVNRVIRVLWLCSTGTFVFWLALGTVAQLFNAKWRHR